MLIEHTTLTAHIANCVSHTIVCEKNLKSKILGQLPYSLSGSFCYLAYECVKKKFIEKKLRFYNRHLLHHNVA